MVIVHVASPEGKVMAMAQKANSLSRTKWLCRYHIVFAQSIGGRRCTTNTVRTWGRSSGSCAGGRAARPSRGTLCPDHVHMLAGMPPKPGVSGFMGYLKGKSSLLMFDRHANLKHEFGNRRFWAEGCYVSTVGPGEATIAKYTRERERADIARDRPGVKEYEDQFAR